MIWMTASFYSGFDCLLGSETLYKTFRYNPSLLQAVLRTHPIKYSAGLSRNLVLLMMLNSFDEMLNLGMI